MPTAHRPMVPLAVVPPPVPIPPSTERPSSLGRYLPPVAGRTLCPAVGLASDLISDAVVDPRQRRHGSLLQEFHSVPRRLSGAALRTVLRSVSRRSTRPRQPSNSALRRSIGWRHRVQRPSSARVPGLTRAAPLERRVPGCPNQVHVRPGSATTRLASAAPRRPVRRVSGPVPQRVQPGRPACRRVQAAPTARAPAAPARPVAADRGRIPA
jgi:hypothetical protein